MPEIEFSYVTEPGVGAGVIRWFTHSDFSHAEVILPRNSGRYGSRSDRWPGVRRRTLYYATFSKDWRVIVPVTAEQEKAFYHFLYEQYGKPYDKLGLFSSFLFDRRVSWRSDQAWWCSELTAAAKEYAGIVKFHTPASRITPNDDFLVTAAIPGARIARVIP
jgi:hypothetical protein